MKAEKKVIAKLNKCYSIAPLFFKGKEHFLVAAEKVDECRLFDLDGNQEDVIWSEPGGVMSMVQLPGSDGWFLATHKFYSPNDAKEAKIILAYPDDKMGWKVVTVAELPFVHRFDIISCGEKLYLIACTIKSDHAFKDDWSSPGKVYAAELPKNLEDLCKGNLLDLKVIMDNMTKNHGYCRIEEDRRMGSLISSERGIFKVFPPKADNEGWEIHQLTNEPASDAVQFDFDGDGEEELGVIAPFHGNKIQIYKKSEEVYKLVYEYEGNPEFSHAIWGGMICGRPVFVVGYRKADRCLLGFTWLPDQKTYRPFVIDKDCGPANVWHYVKDGKDILISTNREIDEIAMYTITE